MDPTKPPLWSTDPKVYRKYVEQLRTKLGHEWICEILSSLLTEMEYMRAALTYIVRTTQDRIDESLSRSPHTILLGDEVGWDTDRQVAETTITVAKRALAGENPHAPEEAWEEGGEA